MSGDIHLSISTAYGDSVEKDVDYVRLPTGFGSVGILKGHAHMLCAVAPGEIDFDKDGHHCHLAVGEGVATVDAHQVIVLTTSLDAPREEDDI